MLWDAEVAVSRTVRAHAGREEVHEKESLYIESQYLASRLLAEAIAARLGEPDGPEIVVVHPETAQGWLEEKAMDSARAQLLEIVRKSDMHGRFRICTPVTEGGCPIYVHAKIVIMEDHLMRVGSSSLNNRPLGFDTECDVFVEVRSSMPAEADTTARIAGLSTRLLAEHLAVEPQAVTFAIDEANGSLIGAIKTLRGGGRSLVPFVPPRLRRRRRRHSAGERLP